MKVQSVRLAHVVVRPEDLPSTGRPEVCIMGRSNVGKSSLMNRLIHRDGMARVSKTPGRTREIHFYLLDDRFYLVDLPGFGYASVPELMRRQWATLMAGYLDHREPLRLGLHLVDVRHDPTELDVQLAEMLLDRKIPVAVVATKVDKVSGNQVALMRKKIPEALALPPGTPVVFTSAATGAGMKELSQIVVNAFTGGSLRPSGSGL